MDERIGNLFGFDRQSFNGLLCATTADVRRLQGQDIHAFLIGEAFMREPDPGAALQALFAP